MLTKARTRVVAVIAAAIVLAAGVVGVVARANDSPAHRPASSSGDAGKLQNPAATHTSALKSGVTAVRVRIPAIGIDSLLIPLFLKPGSSQLQAPPQFNEIGWYSDGTVPGNVGPAVIDGHVDTPTEAGIFVNLVKLRPGDRIMITLSTGRIVTFAIDAMKAVPKDNFPTQAVYGPTPTPQLRVITCNGVFDAATGHYLDNLVVFASIVS